MTVPFGVPYSKMTPAQRIESDAKIRAMQSKMQGVEFEGAEVASNFIKSRRSKIDTKIGPQSDHFVNKLTFATLQAKAIASMIRK